MPTIKDLQAEAQKRGLCCFWKLKKSELESLLRTTHVPEKYIAKKAPVLQKRVHFKPDVSYASPQNRLKSPPPPATQKRNSNYFKSKPELGHSKACVTKLCGKL